MSLMTPGSGAGAELRCPSSLARRADMSVTTSPARRNPKYHNAPTATAPPPSAAANSGVKATRGLVGASAGPSEETGASEETDSAVAASPAADDGDVTSSAGR